jgi:hypothetical protein
LLICNSIRTQNADHRIQESGAWRQNTEYCSLPSEKTIPAKDTNHKQQTTNYKLSLPYQTSRNYKPSLGDRTQNAEHRIFGWLPSVKLARTQATHSKPQTPNSKLHSLFQRLIAPPAPAEKTVVVRGAIQRLQSLAPEAANNLRRSPPVVQPATRRKTAYQKKAENQERRTVVRWSGKNSGAFVFA